MHFKLKHDLNAFAQLVPMVLTVVIVFALLFVGIFVNGEINQNLEDSFPAATNRNPIENTSLNRMGNVSTNQDSTIDIVQVVIIITVLAAAIGAIYLFTKFR